MYKYILSADNLPIKDRLKNTLLYYSRKRGAEKSWKKRYETVFNQNNEYKKHQNRKHELKHVRKWSVFGKSVNLETYRICATLSGISDPAFIPEEVFLSDIEPTLNRVSYVNYISNKSFYNRWFKGNLFPKDYYHRIEGQNYDSGFLKLSDIELRERLKKIKYPVIIKPNRDSYGGKGVRIIERAEDAISYFDKSKNVVMQELIRQHEFFSKFNPDSINTVRVYLYKSVKDNEWKFLVAALRMGKDGSLDNETSGGIFSTIHKNGSLNNYAVDKYCNKYTVHPNSGFQFDEIIPDYDQLMSNSLLLAEQVYLARIVGLDMCYDENQVWRAIEVNTLGHTIRFSQYSGMPFFGEFTDEVIEYCVKNHWSLYRIR